MSSAQIKLLAASFVGPDILSGGLSRETAVDVRPILREPKNFKFMSKMDQLAILSAHRLLEKFPLEAEVRNSQVGLYLCVGVLPFEERELRILGDKSQVDGVFSHEHFVTKAMPSLNPLTTFKCLPNMAAFHLSHNFGLKEAYLVSYPDRFQWAQALAHARRDLLRGRSKYALVGAVTHQQNPLVQNYNRKMGLPENVFTPDCAGMWLLSTEGEGPVLSEIEMTYRPPQDVKQIKFHTNSDWHLGPVSDLYQWDQAKQDHPSVHFAYDNDYYRYRFTLGAHV